jgi:hypothetical protein
MGYGFLNISKHQIITGTLPFPKNMEKKGTIICRS